MKILFTLLMVILVSSACSIKGSFQDLTSYYHHSVKRNPDLFKNYSDTNLAFKDCDVSKVYIINGVQLLKNITVAKKSIVYIWNPKCRSKFCHGPNIVERRAQEIGADLYIVAKYYDIDEMSRSYRISFPIFGIDTKYYGSELTNIYIKRFLKDVKIENSSYSFYLFKYDTLLKEANNLDSLR